MDILENYDNVRVVELNYADKNRQLFSSASNDSDQKKVSKLDRVENMQNEDLILISRKGQDDYDSSNAITFQNFTKDISVDVKKEIDLKHQDISDFIDVSMDSLTVGQLYQYTSVIASKLSS